MQKLVNDVIAFHTAAGAPVRHVPTMDIPKDRADLRDRLMNEEHIELNDAIEEQDLPKILHEGLDLIYVILGTFLEYGLTNYVEAGWHALQKANMDKRNPETGKLDSDARGKVIKPSGWMPVDMEKLLFSNEPLNYTIKKFKNVRLSPAWFYMPDAFTEIMSMYEDPASIIMSFGQHDYVFVALDEKDNCLGFLSCYDNEDVTIYSSMAYVLPQYRRKGIHAALFAEAMKDGQERNMLRFSSGTDVKNAASMASQEKQGRTLSGVSYFTKIPPKVKEEDNAL